MKNDDLNNFFDFFTKETKEIEEVKVDEVKEVVVNTVTKSQRKALMTEEEFDEFFKDIYKTLK
jgi:Icc-related predicted phosphoesterase